MLCTRGRAVVLAVVLAAPAVAAQTQGQAPAGGGLGPLNVQVDLKARVVHANGASIPIDPQAPADEAAVDVVDIGGGKHVVHVRVQATGAGPTDKAWEAILAADKGTLFADLTGYVYGDPPERWGTAVQVVPNGASRVVFRGALREDVGIPGLDMTLLDPQALYPSLDFRTATFQRIDAGRREGAQAISAVDKGPSPALPLAQLLVAKHSSVPVAPASGGGPIDVSRGSELTDGKLDTVWSENRPGMGQGEFVQMAAPHDVPISRMQIVVAPPKPDPNGAAPKRFFLATESQLFEVTMPDDAWLKPGEAYEFTFPQPIQADSIALILSDAYMRGLKHPDVSIAELYAYSEFDGAGKTLDDVAKKLTSERGDAAAEVLKRAGPGALGAVERQYDGLEQRGRARAIDVAASHARCDEAAPLLARGLCEKSGQAPRKAREKLERCPGATTVLVAKLRDDASSRACVAPTLATIAPLQALEPIADALAVTPESDRETRGVLRTAFAQALKSAPPGRVAPILRDAKRSAIARLEILRAAQGRLAEAMPESDAVVAELMGGTPAMRTRYLLLDPLSELARAQDRAAGARLADALVHDADWPVRMHAAELAEGIADAQPSLVTAARDTEPRVREAALKTLSSSPGPGAADAAAAVLGSERWPFVKVQAIGVLRRAPASRSADDAVGNALRDSSAHVRRAALLALGERRATSWADPIRERLEDKHEDADVRAAAAQALGGICDTRALDRLTEFARLLGVPGSGPDEQGIANGAVIALAALQPRDLRERLAPLLAPTSPPLVRAAAQKALSARSVCR
jgi:HEAT repeat protein